MEDMKTKPKTLAWYYKHVQKDTNYFKENPKEYYLLRSPYPKELHVLAKQAVCGCTANSWYRVLKMHTNAHPAARIMLLIILGQGGVMHQVVVIQLDEDCYDYHDELFKLDELIALFTLDIPVGTSVARCAACNAETGAAAVLIRFHSAPHVVCFTCALLRTLTETPVQVELKMPRKQPGLKDRVQFLAVLPDAIYALKEFFKLPDEKILVNLLAMETDLRIKPEVTIAELQELINPKALLGVLAGISP